MIVNKIPHDQPIAEIRLTAREIDAFLHLMLHAEDFSIKQYGRLTMGDLDIMRRLREDLEKCR